MKTKNTLRVGAVVAATLAWSGAAVADGYSAPARYYAPSYNWSGLYGGVNGGYQGTTVNWAFNPAVPAGANQSFSESNHKAVFGVHGGVQFQYGSLVLGSEIAYSQGRREWFGGSDYGINPAFEAQSRMGGIGTWGSRLGWAHDRWLLYATGGYAFTAIDTRAVVKATGLDAGAAFRAESHNEGWYIGGGIEHALHHNIIVGLEYQHFDFGVRQQCPVPGFVANCVTGAAGFNNRDVDGTADVVRLRLSYKFGGYSDPRPLKLAALRTGLQRGRSNRCGPLDF